MNKFNETIFNLQSCGNIYKGLSQTGSWGCFDGELLNLLSVNASLGGTDGERKSETRRVD